MEKKAILRVPQGLDRKEGQIESRTQGQAGKKGPTERGTQGNDGKKGHDEKRWIMGKRGMMEKRGRMNGGQDGKRRGVTLKGRQKTMWVARWNLLPKNAPGLPFSPVTVDWRHKQCACFRFRKSDSKTHGAPGHYHIGSPPAKVMGCEVRWKLLFLGNFCRPVRL